MPLIHDAMTLADWLKQHPAPDAAQTAGAVEALNAASAAHDAADTGGTRLLLSLQPGSRPLAEIVASSASASFTFLNGPEGGLSPAEEAAALACGFAPVTLGPRVLRAETAPLSCLALLTLL